MELDLTEGIRAERLRHAERMEEIRGELRRLSALEEELATLTAADRELEAVAERLEKIGAGAAPAPRPAKRESVRDRVVEYLKRTGEARGTNKLARAIGASQQGVFDTVTALEKAGAVQIKRADTKGTPMVITWVGEPEGAKPAKPQRKITRTRTTHLPSGETERRIREYLKANPRVDSLADVARGAEVPKGSVSGQLVKMEREGAVRFERHSARKVTIHYTEPESSNNGVSSAQEATV